jgi:NTP pyrophosphatase (non-canonical NTP hydrolase)
MKLETFHFPRLKFIEENGLFDQLDHIGSEFQEVIDAYLEEPVERVAEELADLAQSAMTGLYIIERIYGIHPLDVLERVHQKNAGRNYHITKGGTDEQINNDI